MKLMLDNQEDSHKRRALLSQFDAEFQSIQTLTQQVETKQREATDRLSHSGTHDSQDVHAPDSPHHRPSSSEIVISPSHPTSSHIHSHTSSFDDPTHLQQLQSCPLDHLPLTIPSGELMVGWIGHQLRFKKPPAMSGREECGRG
jgi:hypothetical protein